MSEITKQEILDEARQLIVDFKKDQSKSKK